MKKLTSLTLTALASLTLVAAPLAEARDRGGHHGGGGGRPGGGHAQQHGGGGRDFNRPAPPRSQMQLNQGARDRVHMDGGNRDRNVNINKNVNVNVNRNDRDRWDDDRHHHHHGGWDDDDDNPFATAVAVTAGVAVTSAIIGSIVNTVPPNCAPVNYNGMTYQRCGNTWYQPQYNGPNVQFVVIAPPY